jgi:hypothetical protein
MNKTTTDATPTPTITQQAQANIQRPAYWGDVRDTIVGDTGLKFEQAFFEVQKIVVPALEADASGHREIKYTSLPALLSYVRPILMDNGFSLRQFAGAIRGHGEGANRWFSVPVFTKLTLVETGEWEMVCADIAAISNAQSYGSAFTYGKRYGLQSYLGIATADDNAMTAIHTQADQRMADKAAVSFIDGIEKIDTAKDGAMAKLEGWLAKNKPGFELLSELSMGTIRSAYTKKQKEIKAIK